MRRLRSKLTYANVMATIAVFIALGGASFAATQLPKNSVGSKQIKKNAVTTAKIKKEAVTAAKVRKGTLTGTEINASTLGAVPTAIRATTAGRADSAGDANTLQGRGAGAFVQGSGAQAAERRDLGKGETGVTLILIPGVAELTAGCTAGHEFQLGIKNLSGSTADYSFEPVGIGGLSPALGTLAEGGGGNSITTIEDGHATWQVATRTTPASIATFDVTFGYGGLSDCQFFAQAVWGT